MKALLERLVASPVFVLSSIRSGSTLLRCVLDTHTRIHAPHELHLVDLTVGMDSQFVRLAMQVAQLDERELEHLLWDRLLHRELARSGKQLVVDKTPTNVLRWRRVAECWPEARYIFLLRHPVHVVESAIAARPHATPAESTELVELFLTHLREARRALTGLTVRYEDFTAHPERVSRELCEYLDVPWEAGMVEYGKRDHGPFLSGIGDFTDRIRAGRVLPGRPQPTNAEIPEGLRPLCRTLGYL
ncbi:sulfotransferase [Micromonospora sp. CPCC 205371]|nr:sulfotransferase [Micromonospora sp. CPCC 205371]